MAGDRPTTYSELADVIANLPLLVREARRGRRLSQRGAAEQIGISFSTVSRMEAGEDCVLSNVIAVLRWLDYPAARAANQLPSVIMAALEPGLRAASKIELFRASGPGTHEDPVKPGTS